MDLVVFAKAVERLNCSNIQRIAPAHPILPNGPPAPAVARPNIAPLTRRRIVEDRFLWGFSRVERCLDRKKKRGQPGIWPWKSGPREKMMLATYGYARQWRAIGRFFGGYKELFVLSFRCRSSLPARFSLFHDSSTCGGVRKVVNWFSHSLFSRGNDSRRLAACTLGGARYRLPTLSPSI